MKKLSILICTLALVFSLQAQLRPELNNDVQRATLTATDAEIAASRLAGKQQLANATARGNTFFCETFSDGFDGDNGFGAWTFEDSGDNTIWMMADDASPAGEFSTNIDPLESPTAANGWVIFDCDLYNTPISDGYEDVTGWLYTPVLDLGDLNSVIVDYYQYFRYCCFSTSPLTVEVTSDGGTSWTAFPGQGSFYPSANTLSANPLHTLVDVSCAAAGESEVQIRFGFNSAVAAGYSHYFWGIDDVCIYENPVADDLEVVQVTNGDIFNVWEYRVTPFEQRIMEADGGLVAGVLYRNNGNTDQNDVMITVDILDDNMSVINTVTEGPFDMPAFANTPECPSILLDTLFIATGWEPAGLGTYYVRASIESSADDETPENNTMDHLFLYSTDEYGHDDENALDIELTPRENDAGTAFDPTGYGNFYHMANEGSTAFGLTVRFGATTDNDTEFLAGLAQSVDGLDNGDIIASEYYSFYDAWGDGEPVYFPYDDQMELLTGEAYFAMILVEDESENQITVLAQSNSDTDNSTAIYEIAGDGTFVWFGAQTATPAVRLILSERVGVEELSIDGLNDLMVTPNPATTEARVSFSLTQSTVIAWEIRDITGKLVSYNNIGRMPAGANQINLDVNDMAAGSYVVSLVVNGENMISRKLEIVK